jgi:hypothetical protein
VAWGSWTTTPAASGQWCGVGSLSSASFSSSSSGLISPPVGLHNDDGAPTHGGSTSDLAGRRWFGGSAQDAQAWGI